MSSIIKVDQIQLADGSTPTAGDLGLNTTGSVLQVVHTVTNSEVSTTSTSFGDSGLSITITPKKADSSILIMANGGRVRTTSDALALVQVRRNTTEITPNRNVMRVGENGAVQLPMSICALDSDHNSTDAVTYRIYFSSTTGDSVFLNNGSSQNFSITAMEIAG